MRVLSMVRQRLLGPVSRGRGGDHGTLVFTVADRPLVGMVLARTGTGG